MSDTDWRECRECGNDFRLNAHEAEFYHRKALALPVRCKRCRAARKAAREAEAGSDAHARAERALSGHAV